jgi:hypothetical protein
MDQLANHIARQSGLVKLSDDGNKATYGNDVPRTAMTYFYRQ